MIPTTPTTRATTSEKPDAVADALARLDAALEALIEGDGFRAWLDTLAKFHRYSWGNVLLILTQNPDATLVAGYRKWQEMGRQVRKGEKSIRILAPVGGTRRVKRTNDNGDEEEVLVVRPVNRFRAAAVFDVAQTDPVEGKEDLLAKAEPPVVALLDGCDPRAVEIEAALTAHLTAEGVALEDGETGTARGWYRPATKTIRISTAISGNQRLKTLIHEAAHWRAGHEAGIDAADAETVAEAAAYVVLSHFGIDTTDHSVPYIARWAQDMKVMRRNLAAIQSTARALIDAATPA